MSDVSCYVCGKANESRTYRRFVRRVAGDVQTVYTCLGACADTVDDAIQTIEMLKEEAKAKSTLTIGDDTFEIEEWTGGKRTYEFADGFDARQARQTWK